jgi:hypothetical protein
MSRAQGLGSRSAASAHMHRPAGGVIWLVSATVILLAVFAAMVTFFRLADVYHTRLF